MSNNASYSALISPQALKSALGQPEEQCVVLDGSWYMPMEKRNPRAEFDERRLPGARFFDIDAVSDPDADFPHTIPSEAWFAESVSQLGITHASRVIVYDGAGLFSAARVWWMFRLFGHEQVQVLDGGLPGWVAAGYELAKGAGDERMNDSDSYSNSSSRFNARINPAMVANMEDLLKNCTTNQARVLDARSKERFQGRAPEPRPGLPSGHMPGATSLPFVELLSQGRLRPVNELQSIFRQLGVSHETQVITSCGSGVTAAIITLAMTLCGLPINRLYDGSWSEWAGHEANPVVTDLQ